LNIQLEELRASFELQLAELNEAYNEKVISLQNSDADNETLLREIAELQEIYQEQISALNESYNAEIAELRRQLSLATSIEVYEFRVYRFPDPDHNIMIYDLSSARRYYDIYSTSKNGWGPISAALCLANELPLYVRNEPYVKTDVDSIIRDVATNKLAYDCYWEEDDYVVFWFIKAMW
jgi:hypothetical protein